MPWQSPLPGHHLGRRELLLGAGAALGLAGCGRIAPSQGSKTETASPAAVAVPPEDLVPATTVGELPKGTFLESVAIGPDGAVYVASYLDRMIYWHQPGRAGLEPFLDLGAHPLSIVFGADGRALVVAHKAVVFEVQDPSRNNAVFAFDTTGRKAPLVEAPGALFLNGMAALGGGAYAVTDSLGATVWRLDARARTLQRWIEDPRLSTLEASKEPGVNGVRRYGDHLYISNWMRGYMMRAPIRADGSAGPLETAHDRIVVDDFAFSTSGALYGATHQQTVVRLRPNGARHVIAGPAQGVTGSTAVAFGRTRGDSRSIYVVGDGGIAAGGEIEPATLVRLDVGEAGAAV